jgi:hypothetical protein
VTIRHDPECMAKNCPVCMAVGGKLVDYEFIPTTFGLTDHERAVVVAIREGDDGALDGEVSHCFWLWSQGKLDIMWRMPNE